MVLGPHTSTLILRTPILPDHSPHDEPFGGGGLPMPAATSAAPLCEAGRKYFHQSYDYYYYNLIAQATEQHR